jgi:SAM-dependent methyltransferase
METLNNMSITNKREVTNKDVKNLYDTCMEKDYAGEYEYNRWFSSNRLIADYKMTHEAISHHVRDINYSKCFELGPGPGTWTRILYRNNKNTLFTLMDISEAMKNQFLLEMRNVKNVDYKVADFIKADNLEKHDFFFSSRAIEYIEDLDKLFQNIDVLLEENGTGVIITKNPDHFVLKQIIFGVNKKQNHRDQIHIEEIKTKLLDNNFSSVAFFPCVIRIPIIDRFTLFFSNKLFKKIFRRKVEKVSRFAESYVVVFKR